MPRQVPRQVPRQLPALPADAIVVRVRLRAGRIDAACIDATRTLAPSMAGTPAGQLPGRVRGLYALCGHAHAVAAALAVAAARGRHAPPGAALAGLYAERIADAVRSAAIGWPHAGLAAWLRGSELGLAREVLGACADVVAGRAQRARDVIDAGRHLLDAVDLERRALDALPARDPFAGGAWQALGPQLDARVIDALRGGGREFAARPALPGLCLETGAYARRGRPTDPPSSALAARVRARIDDLRDALHRLDDAADAIDAATLCASGGDGDGEGWGAVESPRGRLYHWVRIDAAGCIAAHAVVAPTEWNFHLDGPLVRALRGAAVSDADEARDAVGWMAALMDPCVAFSVEVEAEDA